MEASDAVQYQDLNGDETVLSLLDPAGFVGQLLCATNTNVAAYQIMMHEVIKKRRCELE